MSLLTKPYEISIWQDEYSGNFNLKERKIAIIGSDTMTSQERAMNPVLNQKTNGETNFSFDMLAVYYDNTTGEKIENPFIPYLQSERKVKLNYDGEWFEFLIKNISEDSQKMIFSYQLEDAFVTELSRNGFNTILDAELNNNIGTITELGEKVLEGSGWTIGDSDVCVQTIEEGLVPLKIKGQFSVIPFFDPQLDENGRYTGVAMQIPLALQSGDMLWMFYSSYKNLLDYYYGLLDQGKNEQNALSKEQIQNLGNEALYCLYINPGEEIITDDNRIILNKNCFVRLVPNVNTMLYLDESSVKSDFIYITPSKEAPEYKDYTLLSTSISENFRGKKYVFGEVQKYFPKLKAYGTLYSEGATENENLWGITETEYVSPTLVENLVTNDSFTSTAGWYGYRGTGTADIPKGIDNESISAEAYRTSGTNITTNSLINDYSTGNFQTAYHYTPALNKKENIQLINTGFYDNKQKIGEIIKGDKFILRFYSRITSEGGTKYDRRRLYNDEDTTDYPATMKSVSVQDAIYNTSTQSFDVQAHSGFNDLLRFSRNNETVITKNGTSMYCYIATANYSLNKQELDTSNLKIFCNFHRSKDNYTYQLFEFEIFRYKEDSEGNVIFPISSKLYATDSDLDTINDFTNVKTLTHYCYFTEEAYNNCTSREDLVLNEKTLTRRNPIKYKNAEQVRFVSVKESNYFNNIQTLAETFEMWPKIEVKHNSKGIRTGTKQIIFKKYVGQDNYAGFRYGVNLNGIKRTIDSKQITSKLIVKPNSNEFGKNGFCTISRANSNELKETFMYDFQYYANKGLLSLVDLEKELYTEFDDSGIPETAKSWGGYYLQIAYYNRYIEIYNEKKLPYQRSLQELEGQYTICVAGRNKAEQSYLQALADFESNTGFSLMENKNRSEIIKNSDTLNKYLLEISEYHTDMKEYENRIDKLEKSIENTKAKIAELDEKVKTLSEEKQIVHTCFQKKYARFIQEGTWIDEKYMDDELYYADAQSVLYNSVFPKITYSMNVLEVSQLEGLENFDYALGDRTFVEDVEFFGYNEEGFPYHEEVVITETSTSLDNPSKNSISIQNYKTQFQDLFQRITATVQSVQYSEGSYDKATSFVNGDADKKWGTIQDALNNSSETILQNGKNHSVVWDERGIIVTNELKPSEQVWIQGGAISISTLNEYGEQTWKTAIDGKGISASYLKAGSIDTSLIQIVSGTMTKFRWDSYGITAYTDQHKQGVRFDEYGIYGYNAPETGYFKPTGTTTDAKIQDILNNSRFYLGWNGLEIKGNQGGKVTIGKQDNTLIRVHDGSNITFSVTQDGKITATNAKISGDITATEGVFSNCTIDETCTIKGNLTGSVFTDLHTPVEGHVTQGYLTINYVPNIEYEAVELKLGVNLNSDAAKGEGYIRIHNLDPDTYIELDAGVILIGKENITNLWLYGEYIKLITKKLYLGNENTTVYIKGTQWTNSLSIGDSDINLKNTISSLSSSYSTLFDSLRPVTYKYNNGTSDRLHTGFIAQEVDEAITKAGLTRQDFAAVCIENPGTKNEKWGLRYSEFVALNTSEIQKLKARVAELEQKLQEISV